ncbi:MBL fold metallo-hydrolase [Solwaraspora sp. WMMD1047]|uniref:MBL fold metallo-hydrolase n=1 Tax=Solwaraspora sp. WMMD1047 TaxID=3016102 RepID=UPI002415A9DF|nr:MBL fold metallo-hydrolase [Solwaraspora sp. WMMD1047]MDG4828995.1 MBL fold metallo-hydrolase [Solwaraspora sp. WMMD1047]
MRITVLGGCGAWPAAGQACSGYLVEHEGFTVLLDPGCAVLPALLARLPPDAVDAVLVTHGHPDHCADLSPLLRARVLGPTVTDALPVYAPQGAVDAVLALDSPHLLADAYDLRAIADDSRYEVGPFRLTTRALPHHVPNLGMRLTADGVTLAYTGDTGPSPDIAVLADSANVLLAEATFVEETPVDDRAYLSTARQAGEYAAAAGVGRLVLTHLWPGTEPNAAADAARHAFNGPVDIAGPSLSLTP